MDLTMIDLVLLCFVASVRVVSTENSTKAWRSTYEVTRILDGLILDYQPHVRPNFGGNVLLDGSMRCRQVSLLVDGPTKIDLDIVVNSFGPVQDIDMVRMRRRRRRRSIVCIALHGDLVVHDELLLSAAMA